MILMVRPVMMSSVIGFGDDEVNDDGNEAAVW